MGDVKKCLTYQNVAISYNVLLSHFLLAPSNIARGILARNTLAAKSI